MIYILVGFLLISVAILLMDLKTGWNVETYESRNNVVFSERNQGYGAYEIRQNYSRRLSFILGGMVLFRSH